MNQKLRFMSHAALLAALYVVLTLIASMFGLASGTIQLRLSEMLTVLPALTPAAIPGVWIGCILANILTGCLPWDIVFGSLATLLGLVGCYFLRRAPKWVLPLPTILANAAIIPAVLIRVYGFQDGYPFLFLTVAIGEILTAGVLGILLYTALARTKIFHSSCKDRK